MWGKYNGQWNIEEWRRMFRKRIQKIDDIDINNPHAIIEMRKRVMQNAALSVALMKMLILILNKITERRIAYG